MPDRAGWRAWIEVLTPDDDMAPESEFWTMAPDGVSVAAARAPLVDVRTYSEPPGPDNAIDLLARLPLQSIVFAFTTSSYLLGTTGKQALTARAARVSVSSISSGQPSHASTVGAQGRSAACDDGDGACPECLGEHGFKQISGDVDLTGRIVGDTRRQIEAATGRAVVSPRNLLREPDGGLWELSAETDERSE